MNTFVTCCQFYCSINLIISTKISSGPVRFKGPRCSYLPWMLKLKRLLIPMFSAFYMNGIKCPAIVLNIPVILFKTYRVSSHFFNNCSFPVLSSNDIIQFSMFCHYMKIFGDSSVFTLCVPNLYYCLSLL